MSAAFALEPLGPAAPCGYPRCTLDSFHDGDHHLAPLERKEIVSESFFCVYLIEKRKPKQRIFYPLTGRAFARRNDAVNEMRVMAKSAFQNGDTSEFRVKDYWGKRPF